MLFVARVPVSFLLAASLLTPLSLQAADDPAAIPKGEVTRYTLDQSKIFPGDTRDYWVYVPKQYDPAKPACVHVNQDGVQFNASAVFDELIAKKELPIIIGVLIRSPCLKLPPNFPRFASRFGRSNIAIAVCPSAVGCSRSSVRFGSS